MANTDGTTWFEVPITEGLKRGQLLSVSTIEGIGSCITVGDSIPDDPVPLTEMCPYKLGQVVQMHINGATFDMRVLGIEFMVNARCWRVLVRRA